jgi:hypothetical protein
MDSAGILSNLLIKHGVVLLSGEFENIDHKKFFVVVGKDENGFAGFFFMNSNINKYIQSNKSFFNMQMFIKQSEYDF